LTIQRKLSEPTKVPGGLTIRAPKTVYIVVKLCAKYTTRAVMVMRSGTVLNPFTKGLHLSRAWSNRGGIIALNDICSTTELCKTTSELLYMR
jgi:hypothetical protein